MADKKTYRCHECGGTNVSVEYTMWANPNEDVDTSCVEISDESPAYCNDCEADTWLDEKDENDENDNLLQGA